MYDTMNTQRNKEPGKGDYAIAEALASRSLTTVTEYISQDLAVEDVPLALLGENYRLAALQCLTGAKNSLTTLYGNRPNALQDEAFKGTDDKSSVRESLVFEEEIQQFVISLKDSVRRIAEPDKTKPVDLSPLKQAIMQTGSRDQILKQISPQPGKEPFPYRMPEQLYEVQAATIEEISEAVQSGRDYRYLIQKTNSEAEKVELLRVWRAEVGNSCIETGKRIEEGIDLYKY